MILLDTDHLTIMQWGGPVADRIIRRLEREDDEAPVTSIISYEEQVRGWLSRLNATNITEQVRLYRKLREQLEFFNSLRIVSFDENAAVEFQRLKRLRIRIGTVDLKIAAIAIACDAVLFSRNLRDFGKVPGLRVEDATAA